jgi:hypothetical protein
LAIGIKPILSEETPLDSDPLTKLVGQDRKKEEDAEDAAQAKLVIVSGALSRATATARGQDDRLWHAGHR